MSEQVVVSPHINDALGYLQARMGVLNDMAENLCKQHFDFVMAENKKKTWAEKSVLYAQPRARDNTLAVAWFVVRWYGSRAANTRRMQKKVIIKPKNKHGYTIATLVNKAQYWEADMVSDVEQELIPIRREAALLAKAIGQLNQIIKAAKAGESR